jgi:2-polyprenyl-6-methoxyphenol hydroxylase-like FAD-dependent oxidoreductase
MTTDYMEQTHVIIVGGGPSGLTLGLALAQHEVKVSLCHSQQSPEQMT